MIETDSVTANSRNRRPTSPPISRIGRNTAISERLIDRTVKPTSRAPRIAASNGRMPSSMWRCVFSSTTIASSTTKPVAIVSAISEKMLSEYPSRYIAPNVPISDTGTATLGNQRRARAAAGTRTPPGSPARPTAAAWSWCRAATRGSTVVRSISTSSLIAAGIDARKMRQQRLDAVDRLDDVRVRLARRRPAITAGCPLARPALRRSWFESTTVAMSPSRTGAPLLYATISGRYSFAVLDWSLASDLPRVLAVVEDAPSGGWRWPTRSRCGRPRPRCPPC